jgi:uncharacterized protein YbaR (Trm112 family)
MVIKMNKTNNTNYKFSFNFFKLEKTEKGYKEKLIKEYLGLKFVLIEDVRAFLQSDFYQYVLSYLTPDIELDGVIVHLHTQDIGYEAIYREVYGIRNKLELKFNDIIDIAKPIKESPLYIKTDEECVDGYQVLTDKYNILENKDMREIVSMFPCEDDCEDDCECIEEELYCNDCGTPYHVRDMIKLDDNKLVYQCECGYENLFI